MAMLILNTAGSAGSVPGRAGSGGARTDSSISPHQFRHLTPVLILAPNPDIFIINLSPI